MTEELCRQLGYIFSNSHLLKQSLTHRSCGENNNERLEFLGDSIINFTIAEALFHQYPEADEGDLSRWRATLINRETLGLLGRQFELGRYLHLGQGELKSGGNDRMSIISCTMEAIVGAIYLDSDFATVRDCIMRWYQPLLSTLSHPESHKDPKTQLQEYLQSKHQSLPTYEVEAIEGEAHQQIFIVRCAVAGVAQTSVGKGSSRRRSEQDAADKMLGIIKK